jgi:hypothetical protein
MCLEIIALRYIATSLLPSIYAAMHNDGVQTTDLPDFGLGPVNK